ncbi:hypothetical protein OGAPHI_006941 [Ogataea philodendri]|uniref:Magnesium transporter ALR2 n=1 Tax=Ogataea philodendri TaxID=1378263 RepID=A0A9P8NVM7_9ASCO|nr:uncharacterized protein OGAPHI_006941 [Ogataea philodendri]KAH3660355.1 hypothetical protein OGAPHI_006941 [Ogataea philodendri]
MSDRGSSRSRSPVISVNSTHDEASVHSSISDDSRLNDHRNQNMTLPVKTDSRLQTDAARVSRAGIFDSSDANARVSRKPDQLLDSSELRDRMVAVDDEDEDDNFAIKISSPMPPIQERRRSRARSRSFGEQVKSFMKPREDSFSGGILLPPSSNVNQDKNITIASNNHLGRTISRASTKSDKSRRRPSNSMQKDNQSDNDSDRDSRASNDSQETEEDVCFPMVPEHIRIEGIDFDEIEEFIKDQREENEIFMRREEELRKNVTKATGSEKFSTSALRYTPRVEEKDSEDREPISKEYGVTDSSDSEANGVTFERAFSAKESVPPDRFSFFSSEVEETIHAPDIPSLVPPGAQFQSLFQHEDATWWIDCICPTDNEMKMLAKAFGIHPLTAEDIRMQETREKVELFKNYYFVCFHTFETDSESEDFLEPINVYIVVFRNGILTFHFSPISHPASVRRRVRQLKDYVNVSADWLCYALIDDITDGFAPVIHAIEYEADAIEDSVFLSRENDFGAMLLKIGESRRKVMTLMRLLQGKADVIKMFAKRCQDEASTPQNAAQPRGDIALFLGDIQDHIITMFQSLLSYEKIFSRSHSNYLAQLQVESFYSNNKVTEMLSKVTMLGTILVPLNLVTGLFGMNVKVPGQEVDSYQWFGGIIGFIFFLILAFGLGATLYLRLVNRSPSSELRPAGRSIRSFHFGKRQNVEPQRGRSNRSMISLPSKFTRYGDW